MAEGSNSQSWRNSQGCLKARCSRILNGKSSPRSATRTKLSNALNCQLGGASPASVTIDLPLAALVIWEQFQELTEEHKLEFRSNLDIQAATDRLVRRGGKNSIQSDEPITQHKPPPYENQFRASLLWRAPN